MNAAIVQRGGRAVAICLLVAIAVAGCCSMSRRPIPGICETAAPISLA